MGVVGYTRAKAIVYKCQNYMVQEGKKKVKDGEEREEREETDCPTRKPALTG